MKILEFDVKTGNAMYRDMTAEEIAEIWNLVDDTEVPEPELSVDEALNIIMGVI